MSVGEMLSPPRRAKKLHLSNPRQSRTLSRASRMKNSLLPLSTIVVALVAHAIGAVSTRADETLDWDPEHTWVFVVGLLEWERDDMWAPFPEAMIDRRDQQLVDVFAAAGVPEDQIDYLADAEANLDEIKRRFAELLGQTDEGDLLVFYFAGHGYRNTDTDRVYFANYDAGDEDASMWSVRSIFAAIETHFSGARALLLADCCHSGALYDEARRRRDDSDVAYAVLTSSYAHNLSTGNWTFSDCLLAGLRGEGQVDLDDDGAVDLQEVARYAELELAFVEGQKSMFYAAPEFARRAVLAEVAAAAAPRVGQRLEVDYEGRWYKAKTIDADADQLEIHYVNFPDSWDEWVGPERVRPYQPAQFAAGDKVECLWETDGQWYPAIVRRGWYGLHLVRYDGSDQSDDEWVGPASIRLRTE